MIRALIVGTLIFYPLMGYKKIKAWWYPTSIPDEEECHDFTSGDEVLEYRFRPIRIPTFIDWKTGEEVECRPKPTFQPDRYRHQAEMLVYEEGGRSRPTFIDNTY